MNKKVLLNNRLIKLLQILLSLDLAETGSHLAQLWTLLKDGFRGNEGLYEILNYDSTLELVDGRGERAVLTRHQKVKFLQDHVIAFQDHAWGDGELFAEYHCQPGIPVDNYEDGSKYNVLISLRETKYRGDVEEFRIKRVIRNGFPQSQEWLETALDHKTRRLRLRIIFPKERRCYRAILTQKSTQKTIPLGDERFSVLADGRQALTWEKRNPRHPDLYTIKWRW